MTAIGVALIAQGKLDDARSTLAVGVIMATVPGASVIYRDGRWSVRKQSLPHFGIMLNTLLPAPFLSGWFPLDTRMGILCP